MYRNKLLGLHGNGLSFWIGTCVALYVDANVLEKQETLCS